MDSFKEHSFDPHLHRQDFSKLPGDAWNLISKNLDESTVLVVLPSLCKTLRNFFLNFGFYYKQFAPATCRRPNILRFIWETAMYLDCVYFNSKVHWEPSPLKNLILDSSITLNPTGSEMICDVDGRCIPFMSDESPCFIETMNCMESEAKQLWIQRNLSELPNSIKIPETISVHLITDNNGTTKLSIDQIYSLTIHASYAQDVQSLLTHKFEALRSLVLYQVPLTKVLLEFIGKNDLNLLCLNDCSFNVGCQDLRDNFATLKGLYINLDTVLDQNFFPPKKLEKLVIFALEKSNLEKESLGALELNLKSCDNLEHIEIDLHPNYHRLPEHNHGKHFILNVNPGQVLLQKNFITWFSNLLDVHLPRNGFCLGKDSDIAINSTTCKQATFSFRHTTHEVSQGGIL